MQVLKEISDAAASMHGMRESAAAAETQTLRADAVEREAAAQAASSELAAAKKSV
eukprot:CAMPEP_0198683814 /NCGR_PEP_ID=MMETSP1468-20131203/11249_1 /TAXON_ID=1461545 /ORGANISM="Mantoniella sp, Strain CCMP1436" /LENGTH=54 /DNA_ID=CAMNT_0044428145 /DNA_START=38 /DNA_END=199 /DNA_ORIENTATION=-